MDNTMTMLVDSSHRLIAEQTHTISQLTTAVRELKTRCDAMAQTQLMDVSDDLYHVAHSVFTASTDDQA
eukprot:9583772-Karenia_brevis.AAC.1